MEYSPDYKVRSHYPLNHGRIYKEHLNPGNKTLATGKLSSIFVSEIIKTSMLPATYSARRSNLFLIEFILKHARINLCLLSPRINFRELIQSTISIFYQCLSVTFQTYTPRTLKNFLFHINSIMSYFSQINVA